VAASIERIAPHIGVGEDVTFRFDIENDLSLRSLRLWFLFRNSQGEDVLMLMPIEEQTIHRWSAARFRCAFVNTLTPGTYSVACGILSGDRIIDWVDDVMSVEVGSSFHNGNPYDNRLGAVTDLGLWSVQSSDTEN
jgi:hypothetical protein